MNPADVTDFVKLLSSFVGGRIDADLFETEYLALWRQNLERSFADEVFAALEQVFFDVDAYVSDPRLREAGDLGPTELKESARRALARLEGGG
jgi:hypothetical protein